MSLKVFSGTEVQLQKGQLQISRILYLGHFHRFMKKQIRIFANLQQYDYSWYVFVYLAT